MKKRWNASLWKRKERKYEWSDGGKVTWTLTDPELQAQAAQMEAMLDQQHAPPAAAADVDIPYGQSAHAWLNR